MKKKRHVMGIVAGILGIIALFLYLDYRVTSLDEIEGKMKKEAKKGIQYIRFYSTEESDGCGTYRIYDQKEIKKFYNLCNKKYRASKMDDDAKLEKNYEISFYYYDTDYHIYYSYRKYKDYGEYAMWLQSNSMNTRCFDGEISLDTILYSIKEDAGANRYRSSQEVSEKIDEYINSYITEYQVEELLEDWDAGCFYAEELFRKYYICNFFDAFTKEGDAATENKYSIQDSDYILSVINTKGEPDGPEDTSFAQEVYLVDPQGEKIDFFSQEAKVMLEDIAKK